MRSGFSELRAEMRALHQRMDAGFSMQKQRMDTGCSTHQQRMDAGFQQHREMLALHRQMLFIVAGFVVALIGLLGAVVAQG